MYGLCTGFGVHTALFGLIQSGSITEGFKPCWRTGQSARLETILFSALITLYLAYLFTSLFFVVTLYTYIINFHGLPPPPPKKNKKKKTGRKVIKIIQAVAVQNVSTAHAHSETKFIPHFC